MRLESQPIGPLNATTKAQRLHQVSIRRLSEGRLGVEQGSCGVDMSPNDVLPGTLNSKNISDKGILRGVTAKTVLQVTCLLRSQRPTNACGSYVDDTPTRA